MAGQNKKVRLWQLVGENEGYSGQVLEERSVVCSEHSDIVSCIVSCEGRFMWITLAFIPLDLIGK
jgi:hypothetical protein